MNVSEAAARVSGGALLAVESIEGALERARHLQERANAFITIAAEQAVEAAAATGERLAANAGALKLAGVPLIVQDDLVTVGVRTTAASRILNGFVPPRDSQAVAALRAAGAVPIGKSNLGEFGFGWGSRHSAYGPVRDPAAGGTEANGAAAAVAAGVAPAALTTDGGLGARMAAATAGLVGYAPTRGQLPRGGLIAHAPSLEEPALIARSAHDIGLLLEAAFPAATSGGAQPGERGAPSVGLAVGAWEGANSWSHLRAAKERLEELGATVREVELPSLRFARAAHLVISAAEAASSLARYAGMLLGARSGEDRAGQEAVMRATRGDLLGREAQARALFGAYVLSAEERETRYDRAVKARALIGSQLRGALHTFDALLLPGTPMTAEAPGARAPGKGELPLDSAFIAPSVAGLPAVVFPLGEAGPGAAPPAARASAQLVGRAGEDARLIALAAALSE